MGQSDEDELIYKVTDHLSKVLTEFAGRLAFNSVKNADNTLAAQGVLHLADNQTTLTVDFSAETWATPTRSARRTQ